MKGKWKKKKIEEEEGGEETNIAKIVGKSDENGKWNFGYYCDQMSFFLSF